MKMPSPIDILIDPISIIILVMYGALMAWEAIAPGRELPRIKNWKVRGLASFMVFFYLSTYLPLIWDKYLTAYQLFDLSQIGVFSSTLIAILLYELGVYVWHRAMHRSNTLWKVFHQMHHSAERLDTYGAFYFSPMDMIGWTFVGSLCLVLVIGISPQAATFTILITTFMGIFQHTNIKTPTWLGYIIQRPESHTIHHAKGIHAYNYSDLPIYDILFGTFKNPANYENETGFYEGGSAKVVDMLTFKDISKEEEVVA